MILDHVQLAAPPGSEAEARHFYGGLLGLHEVPKEGETSRSGGCWFRLGRGALHIGIEAEHRPARKAHPGLRLESVAELEELARRLEAASRPVRRDGRLPGIRRFFTEDPWGNRLELSAMEEPAVRGAFPPAEIQTARLRLRQPRMADAAAIFTYASDPEVTRYMAFATHRSIDEAEGFLERGMAAWTSGQGHRPWIIEDRETGELLGAIGTDLRGHRVNVGYILRREAWGRGIMTEALSAIRDAAFEDPRLSRIEAYHDLDNPASGRVMEKVGMKREGVLRGYGVHPQQGAEPRDVVMWGMVRSDPR